MIIFHEGKIADWAYNIYHTLSILQNGNNELYYRDTLSTVLFEYVRICCCFLRCCASIHINNNFAKHFPSSFHSPFISREILSDNCVMHDETMQFSTKHVRVFIQTLFYEDINLPYSNLICYRHYRTLLFEENDIDKNSEHMLKILSGLCPTFCKSSSSSLFALHPDQLIHESWHEMHLLFFNFVLAKPDI